MDERNAADEPATSGEPSCILLVDDNALIRMTTAEDLRLAGFCVLEARDAMEALRVIDGGAAVDMVVTDVEMPGPMDGLALTRHLRVRSVDLPIVVVSGHLDVIKADLGDIPFLSKPCSDEALVALVEAQLKGVAS